MQRRSTRTIVFSRGLLKKVTQKHGRKPNTSIGIRWRQPVCYLFIKCASLKSVRDYEIPSSAQTYPIWLEVDNFAPEARKEDSGEYLTTAASQTAAGCWMLKRSLCNVAEDNEDSSVTETKHGGRLSRRSQPP